METNQLAKVSTWADFVCQRDLRFDRVADCRTLDNMSMISQRPCRSLGKNYLSLLPPISSAALNGQMIDADHNGNPTKDDDRFP
jgi:hypothetical protein